MPCLGPDRYEVENMLYKELDAATRAACAALKLLEKRRIAIPEEAFDWWKVHKKRDAKRQLEEREERLRKKAKKNALAKLSAGERTLLGL